MGIPETASLISVDEYIVGELHSEVRHEYIGGQGYAMSGGSEAHNTISLNLASALRAHFRGKPCKVFMADMKLRLSIAEDDISYYPDLLVSGDPADDAKYYKTRPVVLVEVLSPSTERPSTERLDRREKFLSYQKLSSLEEYVLIDQEQMSVTLFRRSQDWKPEHLGAGDRLSLPSVDFSQAVSEIYEDVPLEAR
jgi:Uma2 family endonuclease